jgi:pimeloyl-ACP methyl ester carboxylesterase
MIDVNNCTVIEYADPAVRHAGFEYYRAVVTDEADNSTGIDEHILPMPVLALGGQYLFGTRVGTMFAKVADQVHTVVVPDAGHYIAEENPAFLIACATDFLDGVSAPVPGASLPPGCGS